jgi:hypothetical protein
MPAYVTIFPEDEPSGSKCVENINLNINVE